MSDYVIVLDTETTGLDKPFCYDISWYIMTKDGIVRDFKAYVVEQVWHNLPLFESAYYKEKRQKYIEMMRKHDAIMNKWGYIMQDLKRDIKKYEAKGVYAYNSDFDDKVIRFNCDWYKCMNPLDNIDVYDIWGYASQHITGLNDYKRFCETHDFFTDTGNYKSSAEVVYRYITNNPDFEEEHMGLFDSEIEAKILLYCIKNKGAQWEQHYEVTRVLPRIVAHPFKIKVDGRVVLDGEYIKKYFRKDVYSFTTPSP
jgi:DNA polymerase III epsilon subunit-like protein